MAPSKSSSIVGAGVRAVDGHSVVKHHNDTLKLTAQKAVTTLWERRRQASQGVD
ncbi:MAG TPA: hypothetical protein VND41_01525 [Nitrososphaerales archaeon]|nr:hypothetical protein [Nitrososphaerales archaeon]